MPNRKKTIDEKNVINLYIIDKLSQKEISLILNCSQKLICNILAKNNVKTRRNLLVDMINRKFGKLLVKKHLGPRHSRNKATLWECLCDCGRLTIADSYSLKHGKHQSCGKCKQYHKISGTYWNDLVWQGTRRKFEFKLTKEYIWELYQKQNGKCALSGLDIDFASNAYEYRHGKSTASLDRIDSKIGYIEGNVQWVHKYINKMKQDLNENTFIQLCKLVAERNNP